MDWHGVLPWVTGVVLGGVPSFVFVRRVLVTSIRDTFNQYADQRYVRQNFDEQHEVEAWFDARYPARAALEARIVAAQAEHDTLRKEFEQAIASLDTKYKEKREADWQHSLMIGEHDRLEAEFKKESFDLRGLVQNITGRQENDLRATERRLTRLETEMEGIFREYESRSARALKQIVGNTGQEQEERA